MGIEDERVHNPTRRYEQALKHLSKANIEERNKEHIRKFIKFCLAEGIGKLRAAKYIFILTRIAGILKKDFEKATKEDIEEVVYEIEGSDYAEWTKHDYKVTLKNSTNG